MGHLQNKRVEEALIVFVEDLEATTWRDGGRCAEVDPEMFYPEKGGSTQDAKAVCRSCEVKVECLDFAVKTDERFGVWGGLSERERRRLKVIPI
ncbi:WhiB family transcription factor [Gordonia phage Pupper]|uniref:WhiB family transcription factor n=1 Tax=Gordonia phage Pupper TaxID=2571249 RepID=A0A4Y6ES15_9CAUD|nr:WhiB family transcription factor [Gordonia phage Pupper]QDF18539.1 WhiB family transcription factor [Gordonia phage Pupper]QDF18772.1 WhiB family transcription factor [Gordonia phage SCentae]